MSVDPPRCADVNIHVWVPLQQRQNISMWAIDSQPLKRVCVLFAVLPPKNGNSANAKPFLHKVLRLPKFHRGLAPLRAGRLERTGWRMTTTRDGSTGQTE